jgi:hypothetical protein
VASRWASVRAALITLALALGFVSGWPIPPAPMLHRLGEPWISAGGRLTRVQERLLAPFRPLADALLLSQRWSLFSGASTDSYRILIEARDASTGRFRTIYRPHDPEHQEEARVLEYRRVRGAWNPRARGPQRGYEAFVAFVARRIFQRHPELSRVRVGVEHVEILPRGRGFRGTGRLSFSAIRDRHEVLP